MKKIRRPFWDAVLLLSCLIALAAPAQNAILHGTVVTPEKVIANGWVVIQNGRIESVLEKAPAGKAVETGGIIFPGFIDLHNHPMYNIFPRWTPPHKFNDRYEWRSRPDYQRTIEVPGGELQSNPKTFCDIDEYVEVKELIGGTTSIAGVFGHAGANPPVPTCVSGLVRNLDWASGLYGPGVGHERIENVLGVTPHDLSSAELARIHRDLADNKVDLLLVHLAEGSAHDTESTVEFRALKGAGLLGPKTAIIHGVGLGPNEFRQMAANGTALIWSPRSNMELYGSTANIDAAYRAGVSIALAPDWSPTGSTNMLAELKFARRIDEQQFSGLFSNRELFEMATAIPARIAHIDDKVGTIEPGLLADLFVLSGDRTHPFKALTSANPQDVQLVMVGGVAIYGSPKLLRQFEISAEPVNLCGATMGLNPAALPEGDFADVSSRLNSDLGRYQVKLAPLAECNAPGH